MSSDVQFNLRIPSELKERVKRAAEQSGRSINAEAQYRLEKSFKTPTETQVELNQTALIQIIMAATKAFGKKGLEWSEIQENLVEATKELAENIKNKKAP